MRVARCPHRAREAGLGRLQLGRDRSLQHTGKEALPHCGTSVAHHRNARLGEELLRVLFIFDPIRRAILLLGGDKTGQWEQWYREAIPTADALYTEYLEELRKEGLIP